MDQRVLCQSEKNMLRNFWSFSVSSFMFLPPTFPFTLVFYTKFLSLVYHWIWWGKGWDRRESDGGDSSHPIPRVLAFFDHLWEESLCGSFPSLPGPHHCRKAGLLPFTRGGVHSFVSLQAAISLGFQTEISLAHLSLLTLVLPKGKAKDKDDVNVGDRKDV